MLALFLRDKHAPVDHKATWTFLNSDSYHGDPDPRPIDRLRTAAAARLSELARAMDSLDRGNQRCSSASNARRTPAHSHLS